MVPDAESDSGFISDDWEDPNAQDRDHDLDTIKGVATVALEASLTCAMHEVLEWFTVDGLRLVNAHAPAVMAEVTRHAEELAAWCWRERRRHGGYPYPRR